MRWIKPFAELGISDVPLVGGKNASLGEMLSTLGSLTATSPIALLTLRCRSTVHVLHCVGTYSAMKVQATIPLAALPL